MSSSEYGTSPFDPEKLTATVEPNRELGWHFNVKSYIPNPVIKVNWFNSDTWVIDCDLTLRNPYTINGYDVRFIIYTTDAGRTMLNADNWTPLYDILGGKTVNPFKAYAKEEPKRVFAGPISHTENLRLMLAGNFNVAFAVDASYPSNCEEPYFIGNLIQEEPLYDRKGANAAVHLYAYRWNPEKWMRVFIGCYEVFEDEAIELDTSNFEYYYGYIYNWADAPPGVYQALISAHTDSPIALYSYSPIVVTQKPVYGWARSFASDDGVSGIETDLSGNMYFALNPTNRVISYTKDATERWQKDLNTLDNVGKINDLSLNQYYGFVYSTACL